MYTGIIEKITEVVSLKTSGTNLEFLIKNPFNKCLRPNQSISHNGVCLTIIKSNKKYYSVIATEETLFRTQLSKLKIGDKINIERCLRINDRLEGHIVQGHIDTIGYIDSIKNRNGSWIFSFSYKENSMNIIVEKGSIAINGISLTVLSYYKNSFSVSIIPYTYSNTNLQFLKVGDIINIEFDIFGKYIIHSKNYFFKKLKK